MRDDRGRLYVGQRCVACVMRYLLAVLVTVSFSATAAPRLEPLRDLAADTAQAACAGQPLVVMFSSDHCTFCHTVRDLYLRPLFEDKRYPGLVIRELKTNSDDRVTNFDGGMTTMQDLAFQYEVYLVPVVAFFGPGGKLLAEPMIGISSQDFYGSYLEKALQTAQQNLARQLSDEPSDAPPGYACD